VMKADSSPNPRALGLKSTELPVLVVIVYLNLKT
jgi:hypothetical protein